MSLTKKVKHHNQKKTQYLTLDSGCDFRKIAKIMTAADWPMNHATARNQLMIALNSLLTDVGNQCGVTNKDYIVAAVNNQEIHSILGDLLYKAYTELKAEKKL